MSLFSGQISKIVNLLPKDGTVLYFGQIFDQELSNKNYSSLLHNLAWENDQAQIFGKLIITKRKVAWYGDNAFEYTYSNHTKKALPWQKDLLEIKTFIEKITGECYNSCLANLYHSGEEGMAWHSDGEKDLKKNGSIASISFGAERKFMFKHKNSKETVSILLEHGSLLEMKDETQSFWLHRLPPTKKIYSPRINLTFRTIVS
jgi:alkylated DNA repair dioxygenase AlkB